MRTQIRTLSALLLSVALAACGSDGNGTGGTGPTSSVNGIVYAYEQGYPTVSGATVEVYGTALSTTTDASGSFTLEGVPDGDRLFITTAAGNWSTVDYWVVPGETTGGADLYVVPDSEVSAWATSIGRAINDNHAMVDVTFSEGAQGGETATIDADSDPPFTFSGWDAVNQQSVIADGGFGELVFPNVNPPSGTVDVTELSPSSCYVDETAGLRYPIFPKTITFIYAYCL